MMSSMSTALTALRNISGVIINFRCGSFYECEDIYMTLLLTLAKTSQQ